MQRRDRRGPLGITPLLLAHQKSSKVFPFGDPMRNMSAGVSADAAWPQIGDEPGSIQIP